jgi:hypothetical protein
VRQRAGLGWEQVGRQGYTRAGYGQVRGLHELAGKNRAGVAPVVVVVVPVLGLHHGMAEQGLRGSCGKQWAVLVEGGASL